MFRSKRSCRSRCDSGIKVSVLPSLVTSVVETRFLSVQDLCPRWISSSSRFSSISICSFTLAVVMLSSTRSSTRSATSSATLSGTPAASRSFSTSLLSNFLSSPVFEIILTRISSPINRVGYLPICGGCLAACAVDCRLLTHARCFACILC